MCSNYNIMSLSNSLGVFLILDQNLFKNILHLISDELNITLSSYFIQKVLGIRKINYLILSRFGSVR